MLGKFQGEFFKKILKSYPCSQVTNWEFVLHFIF